MRRYFSLDDIKMLPSPYGGSFFVLLSLGPVSVAPLAGAFASEVDFFDPSIENGCLKGFPMAIFSQRLDDDNFFDATSSIDANVVDLAVGR